MTAPWEGPLPWDWEQKVRDFVKPQDPVLHLQGAPNVTPLPGEGGVQVALCRCLKPGPLPWAYEDIYRVLRPGGFFLLERTGSGDSGLLLPPEGQPAPGVNLENELPKFRGAGFRVMYRDQAYPRRRFFSLEEARDFARRVPGFSEKLWQARLSALRAQLDRRGYVEDRAHRFLLIGKKGN